MGDTASNLFFQTFGIFLTYFYTDVWGLAPAVIGTMFLTIRLLDAAADPLIGLLADRTQTRWGKFRPFLLWAAMWLFIVLFPIQTDILPEAFKPDSAGCGSFDSGLVATFQS